MPGSRRIAIAPQSGEAIPVKRGDLIRIIDPKGQQVADLWAFVIDGSKLAGDVPPTAQASADGQASANGPASVDGPVSDTAPISGNAQVLASAPASSVDLTADQRADIERGVLRGLPDPNSAAFGPMTARVSRFTSKAYIVCGLVKRGIGQSDIGYQPFVAMFVPQSRTAILIGVGDGRQSRRDAVRKRCAAEGVPLGT